MRELSVPELLFLALGVAGFIVCGCCLVYGIADAEPPVSVRYLPVDACRAVAVSLAALLLPLFLLPRRHPDDRRPAAPVRGVPGARTAEPGVLLDPLPECGGLSRRPGRGPVMHDDHEPELDDEGFDDADEASLADTGRPWGARVIKHPSHAATRAHFAANPLPQQPDRRAS